MWPWSGELYDKLADWMYWADAEHHRVNMIGNQSMSKDVAHTYILVIKPALISFGYCQQFRYIATCMYVSDLTVFISMWNFGCIFFLNVWLNTIDVNMAQIRTYISHKAMRVIIYPCPKLEWSIFTRSTTGLWDKFYMHFHLFLTAEYRNLPISIPLLNYTSTSYVLCVKMTLIHGTNYVIWYYCWCICDFCLKPCKTNPYWLLFLN